MKYFAMKEFECRCCGSTGSPPVGENIEALVVNVLDPARERLGMPIIVNSGYRCPKHNLAVGGVKNSQHMKGEAADITTGSAAGNKRLERILTEMGKYDQLIVYPFFLHVSWKRMGGNRKMKFFKCNS